MRANELEQLRRRYDILQNEMHEIVQDLVEEVESLSMENYRLLGVEENLQDENLELASQVKTLAVQIGDLDLRADS